MRMAGPLAFVGTLTLTPQMLQFKATGKLDRLVGVDDVTLPLSSIGRVQIRPDNKSVTIWLGEKMHRFAGRGALPVAEKLEEQLAKIQDALSSTLKEWSQEIQFNPNQESLACSGRVIVKKPNYGKGWLMVTTKRLLFLPDKRPRKLRPFLEIPDETLRDLAKDANAKETIDFVVSKVKYKILPAEGQAFSEKFWMCCANPELSAPPTEGNAQDGALEVDLESEDGSTYIIQRSVMRSHGPLAFVGNLSLTQEHLEFRVKSKLDRLVGVEDNILSIDQIHRVEDVPSKKLLTVYDNAGTNRYTGAGALAVAERLHALLSSKSLKDARDKEKARSAPMISGKLPQKSGLANTLRSWREEVSIDFEEESIVAASEAVFQRNHETCSGWLLLTDKRMFFLPRGGSDTGISLIEIPVADVRAREDKPITSFSIDLAYKRKKFHFVPKAGQRFVDAFWDHCVSIAPIANRKQRQLSIRSRITGRPQSICFLQDGDELFYSTQSLTMFLKKGLGILLAETPNVPLPKGMPVCIEICQPEGVYSFDTVVLRTGASPKGVQIKDSEASYLILVRMPRQTRCYNRRSDFRMALRNFRGGILSPRLEFTKLSQTDEDDFVECKVQNLSAGGCLIRCHQNFKPGEMIRVALPILGRDLAVRAEVVRVERIEVTSDDEGGYYVALMFPAISKTDGDRIHRFIADMQVIYIRKKRDIADGFEEEEEEEEDTSIQPVVERDEDTSKP